MRIVKPRDIALFLVGCGLTVAHAARHAVPLNDYTRLGQRFVARQTLSAVAVTVPSWLDAEGGLTVTLWKSPERKEQVAQQTAANVVDNAEVILRPPDALPPGVYYWEITQRTGQTRVGLYADSQEPNADDCAYFDGRPDPRRRFLFRTSLTEAPPDVLRELISTLKSDVPAGVRVEAARRLAAMGSPESIPILAGLLSDGTRAHLAREVLESMDGEAAGDALRTQLRKLGSAARVGVINSLGERRDEKVVTALGELMSGPDPQEAAAAAAALGKIGTVAAAGILTEALATAENVRAEVYAGCVDCASRLAAKGQRDPAVSMYDFLLQQDLPVTLRTAAVRGAIVARASNGMPLLLNRLRDGSADDCEVALWVVQYELPGADVTRSLADALPGLPSGRRLALIRALCSRGDPAALPGVLTQVGSGEPDVRKAATVGLGRFPAALVASALVDMLADSDEELSQAAEVTLDSLPGRDAVDAALIRLLEKGDGRGRLRAIDLAGARRIERALPAVLDAATGDDSATRLAALKTLRVLGGGAEVPALLDCLARAVSREERDAAEAALAATCARAVDKGVCIARLAESLTDAVPACAQALLRVLNCLGGESALQAVLKATGSADAGVSDAARHVLADWRHVEAAPELLRLARTSDASTGRLLLLRGYIRLAGEKDLPVNQGLGMCREAAALIERKEEKTLWLGVLGALAVADALSLALPHLDDPAVAEEAGAAVLRITEQLVESPNAGKTVPALQKLVGSSVSDGLRQRAKALLVRVNSSQERGP